MRLFLDECVSPGIAKSLNTEGYVVTSLRDVGGLGEPDYLVLRRCIEQDFVLVTQDAQDFRNLVSRQEVHPGLIILPNLDEPRTETLLRQAIDYLGRCANPMDLMVNHVLKVTENGEMHMDELPVMEAPGTTGP